MAEGHGFGPSEGGLEKKTVVIWENESETSD